MSVKRRELIRYLEKNGFYLLREGGKHSIYTNEKKVIPVPFESAWSLPKTVELFTSASFALCQISNNSHQNNEYVNSV